MAVGGQGDPVGECQAMRHDAGFPRCRIVGEHTARRRVLHDVEQARPQRAAPLRRRKARGRVGEIDRPVRGDDDGVGIADRVIGGHVIGERHHVPVRGDGQQPLEGVGGDQASLGIEVETEHAPARVGEHLLLASIGVHAQQLAALHRRIELAVGPNRDVLGANLAAEVDHAQIRQPRVRRVCTGVARRHRRLPRHGISRNWPETEVGGEPGEREHDDAGRLENDRSPHGMSPCLNEHTSMASRGNAPKS